MSLVGVMQVVTVLIAIPLVKPLVCAFLNLMIWAFVTDIIDYHESLTGLREDGPIYFVYSFSCKVGQAIARGVGGGAIGLVGCNVNIEVQEQKRLHGIYMLGTLAPAIIMLIVFLIITLIYPLNKNRTLQLAEDLKKKRNRQIKRE